MKPGRHRPTVLVAVLAVVAGIQVLLAPIAGAADVVPISSSGSTSSSNATTITLTVFPKHAFQDVSLAFLANVAPRGAPGTIQFMDGTTALGVPVPASGDFALLITALPAGPHSLTAVFTPTDLTAFAPSTSPPVSLTVQPLFAGLGF
jgi:Bacterial Ig-like domain (group 3)